jgi:hypothetical protein
VIRLEYDLSVKSVGLDVLKLLIRISVSSDLRNDLSVKCFSIGCW